MTSLALWSHAACTQNEQVSHPTIAGQLAHCQTLLHTGQYWPSLCSLAHSRHRPLFLYPPSFSNGSVQLEHLPNAGPLPCKVASTSHVAFVYWLEWQRQALD